MSQKTCLCAKYATHIAHVILNLFLHALRDCVSVINNYFLLLDDEICKIRLWNVLQWSKLGVRVLNVFCNDVKCGSDLKGRRHGLRFKMFDFKTQQELRWIVDSVAVYASTPRKDKRKRDYLSVIVLTSTLSFNTSNWTVLCGLKGLDNFS